MQIKGNIRGLFPSLLTLTPFSDLQRLPRIRGASVEANPLSLKTLEKRKKKRIKNWGRRVCALQWWWFYRNDRGKKVRDETIERFYPISDLLSILGHCVHQHNRCERLSWTVTVDCRTSASIFTTIILPLLFDWKAWPDFPQCWLHSRCAKARRLREK